MDYNAKILKNYEFVFYFMWLQFIISWKLDNIRDIMCLPCFISYN
jgi:hypothetical protein